MYDSFVEYQKRLFAEFDQMSAALGFHIIEASGDIERVFERIKNAIGSLGLLKGSPATHRDSGVLLFLRKFEIPKPNGHAALSVMGSTSRKINEDY
jgi:hypothetical protein